MTEEFDPAPLGDEHESGSFESYFRDPSQATEAPLACARLALEVIPLAKRIAGIGNINAISDGGVAAIAAHAALRSALLNVFVNTAVIKDKAVCAPCIVEKEHLLAKGAALETEVFTMVRHKILH